MPHNFVTAEQCKYNTRIKRYPHITKTSCFSRPVFNPDGFERVLTPREEELKELIANTKREFFLIPNPFENDEFYKVKNPDYKTRQYDMSNPTRNDSIKRSRDKAFDIALSNDFQYFITFTLDETKISRYNTEEILKKLKTWLDNAVRRKNFKYIIFPEFHKKENEQGEHAIHFHGLCSGNLSLSDSGKTTSRGQIVYNCDNWGFGFSTVIKLDENKLKIVSYVMKYMTKDNEKIFGKFYFSGGKNLIRDYPSEYLNEEYLQFEGEEYNIPTANMSVKYHNLAINPDELPKVDDVATII